MKAIIVGPGQQVKEREIPVAVISGPWPETFGEARPRDADPRPTPLDWTALWLQQELPDLETNAAKRVVLAAVHAAQRRRPFTAMQQRVWDVWQQQLAEWHAAETAEA